MDVCLNKGESSLEEHGNEMGTDACLWLGGNEGVEKTLETPCYRGLSSIRSIP